MLNAHVLSSKKRPKEEIRGGRNDRCTLASRAFANDTRDSHFLATTTTFCVLGFDSFCSFTFSWGGMANGRNELIVRDRESDRLIYDAAARASWGRAPPTPSPSPQIKTEERHLIVPEYGPHNSVLRRHAYNAQHQQQLHNPAKLFNRDYCDGGPPQYITYNEKAGPRRLRKEVVLLNGGGSWESFDMHSVASLNGRTSRTEAAVRKENVSPGGCSSDSGIEGDCCSEGNLSWLLNYRIHELPPVPDCSNTGDISSQNPFVTKSSDGGCGREFSHVVLEDIPSGGSGGDRIFNFVEVPQPDGYYGQQQNMVMGNSIEDGGSPLSKDNGYAKGQVQRYAGLKKPPFTYTELIEHALKEKGELTVSGIYQWISDHFPFYKQNDDRWKNSVRHNLSINPHFRKGSKAVHGAGHLWTIAQRAEDPKNWNIRKQKMQQFMRASVNSYRGSSAHDLELEAATASILPENQADAKANEMTLMDHLQHQHQHHQQHIACNDRGEPIPVEINYVNVLDIQNGLGDFLCPPVPKEQVVAECGLSGDYLITDLNPNALGLNLGDADIVTNSNLYDELSFQCYEIANEQ